MTERDYVSEFYKGIKSNDKDKLKKPCEKESISAAINFAYGDTKRTLKGISNYAKLKENAINKLTEAFKEYFNGKAPESADEFNKIHNELCMIWVNELSENPDLSKYGKAQKIVNMTFKYLYCCKSLDGYEEHFDYCHMPLDSFTLEWFKRNIVKEQRGIKIGTWSSMNNSDIPKRYKDNEGYQTYNYYVDKIKEYCDKNEKKPLLLELEVWPQIQRHLAAEAFLFALKESISSKEKKDIRQKSLDDKLQEIKDNLSNWK